MNRKVLVITAALLATGAIAAFAQARGGNTGGNAYGYNRYDEQQQHAQQQNGRGYGIPSDAEEVELSGTIQITEDELPVLKVGSDEYTLMIPPALATEIEVQNNARVQITGYAFEGRNFDLTGNDQIVHVRILQIGNNRYITGGGRW